MLGAAALLAIAALDTDVFGQQPLRDFPVADGPGTVAHVERRNGLPTFIWAESGPSLRAQGLTPEQAARRALWAYASRYRVSPATLAASELWRLHDTGWGAVIVSFVQRRGEVPVFRETLNVVMDRELRAVALTGYLSPLPEPTASARLTEGTAIAVALQAALGKWYDGTAFAPAGTRGEWHLYQGPLLRQPAWVRRVDFALADHLEPAFDVDLDAHRAVISSVDGRVLHLASQVQDATGYRVWADSTAPYLPWPGPGGPAELPLPSALPDSYYPAFVAPQLVSLDNAGIATNDPWLPANATALDGNNVRAYANLAPPDGLTLPDGGSTSDTVIPSSSPGLFDWTYDLSKSPDASVTQHNASGTQAFYVANWLHDLYYGLGFDEASGNAQVSNFGRGGKEGDALQIEVQDYAAFNNASMNTPPDGKSPELELFVFTSNAPAVVTAEGSGFDAGYIAGTSFGPAYYDVTGPLSLGISASDGGTDGCSGPFPNRAQVSGGVVLLANNGGRCQAQDQLDNAADAGAQAVILTTNGNGYTNYVGLLPTARPTVNLPAPDSVALRAAITGGTALSARVYRAAEPDRDPALDGTVTAHEWAHYLSNRLVGDATGIDNSPARGMGEGWSDFNALLTLVTADDATVPSNAMWKGVWSAAAYAFTSIGFPNGGWYFGVRRFPYSIDRTKNNLSFRHVQDGEPLPTTPIQPNFLPNTEPHNTGEVWCTVLFEAYVSLLNDNRLTFTEAQRRMRSYLVSSLKATPFTPTFLEARDAWLAVAAASDLADLSDFVQAFARRGMGPKATGPDRYSTDNHTVVEDFGATATQAELSSVTITDDGPKFCDGDGMLDVGEEGHVVVALHNTGTAALPASTGTVTSTSAGVVLSAAGALSFPAVPPFSTVTATTPIAYTGARGPIAITLKVTAMNPSLAAMLTMSTDLRVDGDRVPSDTETFEAGAPGWTYDWQEIGGPIGVEQVVQLETNSAIDHLLLRPVPRYAAVTYSISPPLAVGSAAVHVGFKHRYDFRTSGPSYPDGAILQVSADLGNTWVDVPGSAMTPPYPVTLAGGGANPLRGKDAWAGVSTAYPMLLSQDVNLGTAYAGQTIKLRFALGVDSNATTGVGWEVDDIQVTGLTAMPFVAIGPDGAHCVNRPPVANAGPDQLVDEGAAVHLDGTGSTDPDGQTLTLTWAQKSGPTVTLNGADFTAPMVTADTPLVFTLTASDGTLSSTDDVTVTVRNVDHAPVVTAMGPASVAPGDNVTLTGTASDADGDPVTLQWAQTAGTHVTLVGATTLTASFTAPADTAVENLAFVLTASAAGASAASAPVTVAVTPGMAGSMSKPCGCGSAPGLLVALAALGVRRRRKLA